jgi:glyoxylase-like metal-dependent hydrolase (beta-lactamase superfamily II)
MSEITKNKINQYDEEEKKKVKKLLIKNVDEKYIPPKKIIEKYGFFNPKNAKIIKDGDTIDLGNRKLKILSTPGHTDDSVSVYDERGYIFIGDFMYEGELWASTPDNDPVKYYQSLKRLNENYPELKGIYSGHFTPNLGGDYISKMFEIFSELKEKNLLKKGIGNYKKGSLEVIL